MKKTWAPTFRYIVFTIIFIFAVLALWVVRDALQPLLIAALAAYFLSPAVLFLTQKLKMRRKVAANVVYFSVMAILIAIPFTVLPLLLDELQGIVRT